MNRVSRRTIFIASAIAIATIGFYITFIASPSEFPNEITVTVPSGASVSEVAELLRSYGALSSPGAFRLAVRTVNPDAGVLAGTYALNGRENVLQLAYRFARGDTGIAPVRVTVPEGLTAREIAPLFAEKLDSFDVDRFRVLAEAEEGYLFPDTYTVALGTEPAQVVALMKKTFVEKTAHLNERIATSGKTTHEIVTMASIIEREARQPETRRIISDILWRRIDIGMALQVDAVFGYILKKSGYAPTFDDLKIVSPYNTYLNRDLPPGPISNPGIDSILSALEPTPNEYLYYLTGADGNMYYAKTFEKHVANRVHLK